MISACCFSAILKFEDVFKVSIRLLEKNIQRESKILFDNGDPEKGT